MTPATFAKLLADTESSVILFEMRDSYDETDHDLSTPPYRLAQLLLHAERSDHSRHP